MNTSVKQVPTSEKWHYLFLGIVVLVLLFGIFVIRAHGNKDAQISQEQVQGFEETGMEEPETKLTVWDIIHMTDWLLWPFILITALGIMLTVYHILKEHQDKIRSRLVIQNQINSNDMRGLLRLIQITKENRASRLIHHIMVTFNKTNKAEPIGDDITQFISGERESFETYNRTIGFLSDSAGALGLLGTVWGIFQTFHAGKLDGPTILQGMSISLVTTLVGLIISLLLNMGSTYVFTIFNGQLKLIGEKAEELRQALLYLEKKVNGKPPVAKERPMRTHPPETDFSTRRKPAVATPAEVPF